MEKVDLNKIIWKAARADAFLTQEQRREEGIRTFKRKAIGLCGNQTVKTLDEMAQLLYDTKVASSVEEGRELTPLIMGQSVSYGFFKVMAFDELRDGKGNTRYRILVYDS